MCLCVCFQIKSHAYNLVIINHVIVVVFSCFHKKFWLARHKLLTDIPR